MRTARAAIIWVLHTTCYSLGLLAGFVVTVLLLMWAACLAGYRAGRYR